MVLGISALFSSCKDDKEEFLIPIIDVINPDIYVGYAEGDTLIEFSSNVILYANVEKSAKDWLSVRYEDNCKTMYVQFLENDITDERVGQITLSKNGVEEVLTITQEANPVGGGAKIIDLNFSIDNSSGYTILSVSSDEVAKIPIGATVLLKCPSDDGTVSLLNPATYAEYVGGSPVNGEFKFVWTLEMAGITASSGMMAILRDGFDVESMYCAYQKTDLVFNVGDMGGYNAFTATPEEAAKIPIGATVVLVCPSNTGTISFLNTATYAEYAGGSPVGGKFAFKWTQEIADIATTGGIIAILRDGFDVSGFYSINMQSELDFAIGDMGGYTALTATAEEAAKIPIGATVVLVCSADAGSVRFLNTADYSEYASGSPINGRFTFVWTKDMAEITRAGVIAILSNGFDVTSMYCQN
ncbi:BACON domain-containing protein [uncultured Draconibacterium sp.]|uniref:BACON domain-containing protein n=1 Tax=uncultured Draconibacterium sp. TaxID=1573823 RepID=UPI003216E3A8